MTTLEGLADDPMSSALRGAFTAEHALQCGFCTPAMLITARDIITRLPDADAARCASSFSGNLCRCTGYVGIVRRSAACCGNARTARSLRRRPPGCGWGRSIRTCRRGTPLPGGGVGGGGQLAETSRPVMMTSLPTPPQQVGREQPELAALDLASRQSNIELRQSFTVARPQREVWDFLGDLERVVPCMPGAETLRKVSGDRLEGQIADQARPDHRELQWRSAYHPRCSAPARSDRRLRPRSAERLARRSRHRICPGSAFGDGNPGRHFDPRLAVRPLGAIWPQRHRRRFRRPPDRDLRTQSRSAPFGIVRRRHRRVRHAVVDRRVPRAVARGRIESTIRRWFGRPKP